MPQPKSIFHEYVTVVDNKRFCNYCNQTLSCNISRVRTHFEQICPSLPLHLSLEIRGAQLIPQVGQQPHIIKVEEQGLGQDMSQMSDTSVNLSQDSSQSTGHKPKSAVWLYYTQRVDIDGNKTLSCNFCSSEMGKTFLRNATRLRQHLTNRCKSAPDEVKRVLNEETEKANQNASVTKKKPKVSKIYDSEEEDETNVDNSSRLSDSDSESVCQNRSKNPKTLEEENSRLSSKLKICQKQKEALLQINKYLDKSLSLMEKLNQVYVNVLGSAGDQRVDDLNRQIDSSNDSVKEWKKKYNLIEFDDRMKKMFKLPVLSVSENQSPITNRPQSSIWKYFDNIGEDSAGYKTIKCKFCDKTFCHKNLNATKCRTHIVESCENCPSNIKDKENNWIEYHPKSQVDIWQYFSVAEDAYKTTATCIYCGLIYMGKNATKCRGHLVGKCELVPNDVREAIANKCDTTFVNNSQLSLKTKMSNVWKHFDVDNSDGKYSCVCIYCRHTFSYKNATKCRKHLIDKCTGIPGDIQREIAEECQQSGRTWIKTKIPIWEYFDSGVTDDGRESLTCRFCSVSYNYRNATKMRHHLLAKCPEMPEEMRQTLRQHCKDSFYNQMENKSTFKLKKKKHKEKKSRKYYTYKDPERKGGRHLSAIWDHFRDETDDNGSAVKVCKYCEQTYNYRNATKMRHHLTSSCKAVPEDVQQTVKEMNNDTVRPYRRRFAALPGLHECCWPGCDLKFPKLSRLRAHQLSHTGNVQRVKCDWPGCEWSGRSKSDAKIHRCIHTGEKPYVCDWPGCDFKTAKPSSIWLHKRRHKELYKFGCDWPGCERRFLTAWERVRHKNTHLGLKPFACQFCDKRYPIAYKLKVHQNKHHLNLIRGSSSDDLMKTNLI